MKTNSLEKQDSEPHDNDAELGSAPGVPTALRALRWLERCGLVLDRANLKKAFASEGDAWYASVDGEVYGPGTFRETMELLIDGHSPIDVVHASEAEGGEPPWRRLSYSPLWLRPWPARMWTVGFWAALAMVGYCAVMTFTPHRFRLPVDVAYWIGVAAFLLRGRLGALWTRLRPAKAEPVGELETDAVAGMEEEARFETPPIVPKNAEQEETDDRPRSGMMAMLKAGGGALALAGAVWWLVDGDIRTLAELPGRFGALFARSEPATPETEATPLPEETTVATTVRQATPTQRETPAPRVLAPEDVAPVIPEFAPALEEEPAVAAK